MAIYRNVSMSFWTDSKVVDDFTPKDRLFYLYLITNPHTNLAGCYEVSLKQISIETGYDVKSVKTLINRFVDVHGLIRFSERTKEILLLKWEKYNWIESESFRKPLQREIDSIKCSDFKEYLIGKYTSRYRVDTVWTPCEDGVGVTVTDTDTVTVTVSVTDTDADTVERYGEFSNVILTDEEHEKLVDRFPMDYQDRIEELSVYLKKTGKTYKSHYATILSWDRKAKKEQKERGAPGDEISRWEVDF